MTRVSQGRIEQMTSSKMASQVNDKQGLPGQKLGRVERRRQDTYQRILAAAEQLMRERPVDSVTISDITEAADVGHGSFYLHFKSKYEVLLPLIQAHTNLLDERLQKLRIEDPAELMAVSGRYMGRVILADPLWRWCLEQAGTPVDEIRKAVGRFSARDFARGMEIGRFNINDPASASSFAMGGFVNCMMSALPLDDPSERIDAAMTLVLLSMGIAAEEAAMLAHAP